VLDYFDFSQSRQLAKRKAELARSGYKVTYRPFVYAVDFLPLTGNTTVSTPFTVDGDAPFIWCAATFSAFTAAGAAQSAPNILLRLRPETSQRELMSAQVHLISLFGTGERPHLLFVPMELPAKSALSVEADSETATDINLRLSFIGVKVFLKAVAGRMA
jgi:hypothetical protein